MEINALAANMAMRMREIDGRISKSLYRKLNPGEQDECPTGDDYNLLWDAILDEFRAAGFDLLSQPQGANEP